MALSLKLLTTLLSLFFLASAATIDPPSLAARLRLEGEEGSSKCWDSLFQLQSCTGEVLLFFLNGETYLGPSCCAAIRIIESECWPAMLGSLGFTAEEGGVLRGYCNAAADSAPAPPHTAVPNVNTSCY